MQVPGEERHGKREAGSSGPEAGVHLAHPLNSAEASVLEPGRDWKRHAEQVSGSTGWRGPGAPLYDVSYMI